MSEVGTDHQFGAVCQTSGVLCRFIVFILCWFGDLYLQSKTDAVLVLFRSMARAIQKLHGAIAATLRIDVWFFRFFILFLASVVFLVCYYPNGVTQHSVGPLNNALALHYRSICYLSFASFLPCLHTVGENGSSIW